MSARRLNAACSADGARRSKVKNAATARPLEKWRSLNASIHRTRRSSIMLNSLIATA